MDLNKKIEIKLKYLLIGILAILLSIGVAVNEMKSNTTQLEELTKIEKVKVDSISTQLKISNTEKDSLQVTIKERDSIFNVEKDSLFSKIKYYQENRIIIVKGKTSKKEYYENGNLKSEENTSTETNDNKTIVTFEKEYNETKDKLSSVIKEKDTIITKLSKKTFEKDSLNVEYSKLDSAYQKAKFNTLVKNQIIVGNNISSTKYFKFFDNTYLEFNHNHTKTIFTKVGINHDTFSEQFNSFSNINNYKAYIGFGYKFNL